VPPIKGDFENRTTLSFIPVRDAKPNTNQNQQKEQNPETQPQQTTNPQPPTHAHTQKTQTVSSVMENRVRWELHFTVSDQRRRLKDECSRLVQATVKYSGPLATAHEILAMDGRRSSSNVSVRPVRLCFDQMPQRPNSVREPVSRAQAGLRDEGPSQRPIQNEMTPAGQTVRCDDDQSGRLSWPSRTFRRRHRRCRSTVVIEFFGKTCIASVSCLRMTRSAFS